MKITFLVSVLIAILGLASGVSTAAGEQKWWNLIRDETGNCRTQHIRKSHGLDTVIGGPYETRDEARTNLGKDCERFKKRTRSSVKK